MRVHPIVFDDTSCRLGEGAVWDDSCAGGALLWVDIPAGLVFRKPASGGRTERIDLGQSVGCVFPRFSEGYVAGLRDGVAAFDFERGITGWVDRSIGTDPETRCNDGAIDRRGRLWVGVMPDDQRAGAGRLLRIDGTGPARIVREGLTVPNGIAWSADGGLMFHIDSPRRVIKAIEFDEASGELGDVVRSIHTPEAWGYPDGMTVDEEGCLWVAHWAGSRVSRWDPFRASCIGEIALPTPNVTSCAFGGEGFRDLFITTARDGDGVGGEVFVCRPGPVGQRPGPPPYRPHDAEPRSKSRA
jgi:sugar lactone lactonase YvrE